MPVPIPVPPSINQVKDLTLKVQVAPELEREISTFFAHKPPLDDAGPPAFRRYFEEAVNLVSKCVAFADHNIAKLTEARFSVGDANSFKQKNLGEPRRQSDAVLNSLKQKLAGERGEWTRRITKQAGDVIDQLDKELKDFPIEANVVARDLFVAPNDAWLEKFMGWFDKVFDTWIEHLEKGLPAKAQVLINPEIATLRQQLEATLPVLVPPPTPMLKTVAPLEMRGARERMDVPTPFEVFFESFKGGLNTVAMIAGMVVLPVAGSLFSAAKEETRAMIMGGCLMPIIVFSAFEIRKTRARLIQSNTEKAKQKLKKDLETACKLRIDRFKQDAERYTQAYLAAAQQHVGGELEAEISRTFQRREEALATELARVQLEADRVADQLNAFRQAKQQLATMTLIDLKRRLKEVEGS